MWHEAARCCNSNPRASSRLCFCLGFKALRLPQLAPRRLGQGLLTRKNMPKLWSISCQTSHAQIQKSANEIPAISNTSHCFIRDFLKHTILWITLCTNYAAQNHTNEKSSTCPCNTKFDFLIFINKINCLNHVYQAIARKDNLAANHASLALNCA